MKVSIIIPVYNGKKTVRAAVESAVNGAPDTVEVVVVNDGSTDGTEKVLDELAAEYSCVRVFSKPNGGVSSARNYGIEKANGDFLMFLDADDTFEPGAVQTMIKTAEQNNADITMFGYRTVAGSVVTDFMPPFTGVLKGKKEIFEKLVYPVVFSGENGYIASVWTSVFKKSVITDNALKFDTRIKISEDTVFMTQFWLCCNEAAAADKALLTYNLADGSATKRYASGLLENHETVTRELEKSLSENGIEYSDKIRGTRAVAVGISLIVNEARSGNPHNFFESLKCVFRASSHLRKDASLCCPESKKVRIKKHIVMCPVLGAAFLICRKIQAKRGVSF